MKADGSEFPVEISISRIGHEDPPMFAAYVRDVTARKAAEESVRRLAAIVEHSNDAIVATDLRGTIVAWNPAAETLYGWTADEIIGRHISATAPADRQSEANFLARQVAEGKAVSGHRTVRMRKDGSLVDVSLTISPILGSDEQPVGMAGIIRDITEEKRIEGERIRLLDQEKVARLRAEELEQRASFIAEAQAALDSSLKFDEVLRRLTRLIVPMFADWCAVHMLEADGSIRQVAVGHVGPGEGAARRGSSTRRYPPDPDDPQGVPGVLRSGEPQHVREITDDLLEAGARDAEHLEIVRGLGLRSAMIVPLRARSQTLGAITFVSAESERLYGEEDLAFASELGRRAALSIDNARLHSELASRSKELEFLADASAAAGRDARPRGDAPEGGRPDAPGAPAGRRLHGRPARRRPATSGAWRRPSSDPDVAARCSTRLREQHIDLDSAHPIAVAMRTGQLQRVETIDERAAALLDQDDRVPRGRPRLAGASRRGGADAGARPDAGRDRDRLLQRAPVQRGRRAGRARARAAGGVRGRQRAPVRARRTTSPTGSSAACCRPTCRRSAASRSRPASAPPGTGTRSAATSTTSSRPGRTGWAITIGDVCGKGPDAAAVTALARHTLRASAIRGGDQPDELLRALNDAMLVDNPTEFQFCTVAFAGTRDRRRVHAAGGVERRPPAARSCCAPDGEVESVGEPGTLLGVVPDPALVVRRDRALPRRHAGLLHGRHHRGAHPARGCSATRAC